MLTPARALGLLAFSAVAVTAAGCNRPPPALPKDAGPPKVTAATPLVRTVTEFTDMTGTLAATKTADVRARVSGYVQKVLFQEGSEVKAGDDLVQLDPEPFQVALGQAEAAEKSAVAQEKLAAATAARLKKGLAAGAASPEEYEQAAAQVGVTKAGVEKAQKDVEQAKLNLSYATVKAPFDGRIDRVFVNEGNVVTGGTGQGTVLTRVVPLDPIYAYFTVDEQTVLDYLRRMTREGKAEHKPGHGPPVEMQLRDETGYPHKGRIDFASAELNPTTGTLQLRGTFPNPGPPRLLRPGLFVRGRIPAATAPEATLIPDAAVVTDQAQRVVYVVGPGNRVVSKPVTLGPRSMGLRVVEGLAPTDRVITKGLARIQPDMVVDPQPGTITPVEDTNTAAGPGGWGSPGKQQDQGGPPGKAATAPAGNPGAGAAPGVGGNAATTGGGSKRGRPAEAANPPGK